MPVRGSLPAGELETVDPPFPKFSNTLKFPRWSLRAEWSPPVLPTWRPSCFKSKALRRWRPPLPAARVPPSTEPGDHRARWRWPHLAESTQRPLLVVLPRPSDLDDFAADLLGFLGTAPEIFPAWETLPQDYSVRDAVYGGRLRVLGRLGEAEPPRIVVTTFRPCCSRCRAAGSRAGNARVSAWETSVDTEDLLRWLVDCGFERVPAIEVPGEFCLHGGIFDLFPADAEDPVRIELFGNEVESIRRFDAETQRKLEDLTEVELTVLRAGSAGSRHGQVLRRRPTTRKVHNRSGESFLESLPAESAVVLCELGDLLEEAKAYLGRLDDARGLFSVPATMARLTQFPVGLRSPPLPATATTRRAICGSSRSSGSKVRGQKHWRELESLVGRDEQVLIACHNEGERARLAELLSEPGRTLGRARRAVSGTRYPRLPARLGRASSSSATRSCSAARSCVARRGGGRTKRGPSTVFWS